MLYECLLKVFRSQKNTMFTIISRTNDEKIIECNHYKLVQDLPQLMYAIDTRKQRCNIVEQIYSLEHPQRKIPSQRFRRADECLSEQFEPSEILCRSQQIQAIKQFMIQFVRDGRAKQSLYIAGVPGIGKTLSVNKAIEQLTNQREQFKKTDKCKIKIVKLNAMKLKNPVDIYKNLYLDLCSVIDTKKKKISPHNALITLDGIFRKNQLSEQDIKLSVLKKIVVIDEIDHLKTNNQDILYNLFDWTQSQHSKLAIIAISNTIDFPQLLKPKICSRIGNKRLTFKPYTNHQLQKILNQRVEETEVFQKNVINFISKKIAKSTSDIRKCFNILKQAIYLHTKNGTPSEMKNSKVSLDTVNKAYDQIYSHYVTQFYKGMPTQYRKVLVVLAQYFQRETRSITFEALCSISKSKFSIDQQSTKYILISLMEMEAVQVKNHVSRNLEYSRFQNEWNIKLMLESDKILYASLKIDTQHLI